MKHTKQIIIATLVLSSLIAPTQHTHATEARAVEAVASPGPGKKIKGTHAKKRKKAKFTSCRKAAKILRKRGNR